jgi:superoxide dismutase, Cu-Zn family
MRMIRMNATAWSAVCALTLLACVGTVADHHEEDVPGLEKAICVLTPTEGNTARGTVTFTQQENGVLIEAHVSGLKPNSKHGFHIHEFGDITAPDGTSTGGHFNPDGHDHAGPDADARHMGDLGNLESDADGHAHYSRVDTYVKIHSILSRGIVVHAGTDDLATQPTGDAGGRIAVGVIGLAKAE